VTRTKRVIVKVTCKLRRGCRGTVRLLQGSARVGSRRLKLRYRQTKRLSITRSSATIARSKRLRVKAPRGVRAKL
jgi:hypothetical protein